MRALIKMCHSLFAVSLCLVTVMAPAAIGGPGTPRAKSAQAGPSAACAAAVSADLCALVESGRLADLRWPDFSDYRTQVRNFYLPANYQLAWTKDGQPTTQARGVIRALQDSEKAGLRAADYDGPRWDDRVSLLAPSCPASDLAHFDLALTISVMRYLADVHSGRISPKYFKFGLDVRHKRYDVADFLHARLASARDVAPVLADVEPPYPGYQRTKAALERYLALEKLGDPPALPRVKKPVEPGAAYPALAQLDQRLRQLGDLSDDTAAYLESGLYQGALVQAVKHFQQRHDLAADGCLGVATIQQLNVPLHRRVMQLRLALERWRWLPHDLPPRFLSVNIPGFELYGYENHHVSLTMPVVVGRAFQGDKMTALPEDIHQTPVFMDEMEYIIFRPYWNIPVGITRKEILPALKKDPEYLAKHRYEVYDNQRKVLIIQDQLDDKTLEELQSGDLEFRQKPGPGNSLGLIKFVFPNNYDVYLHGTPEKQLFARSRRDYSHGCIRVQDPVALAEWTLRGDPEWTQEHILAATKNEYPKKKKKKIQPGDPDEPLQVKLPKPIPVLILYATAYVEENGDVGFFDDIYGYDKDLERALSWLHPYFH
ncbi:MAG TPA: L,D-transpeptidase family protein [Candidatus Angelobacter sp.]